MASHTRSQLVAELIQSHLQVRQLFMKSLHQALPDEAKQGCFTVLQVLDKHGPLSQHAIAQELFHSDAAVSRQIKLLLKQNYISTSVDPTNRRRTMIQLTKQGRVVLRAFQTTVNQQVAKLLTGLSDSKLKQCIQTNQQLQQLIIKQSNVSHD
jgi:DNA-binding MarR family transcriptional regulator